MLVIILPYCREQPEHSLLNEVLALSPCKKQRPGADTHKAHISGDKLFFGITVAIGGKLLQGTIF